MAGCPYSSSRRGVLGGLLGGAGAAVAALSGGAARAEPVPAAKGITETSRGPDRNDTVPFHGPQQAGILTAQQNHTFFAAFDVVATDRAAVADLLRRWTVASARMARAEAVEGQAAPDKPDPDTGEARGLAATRLTLTFGFGAGLFTKDGKDRFGLAHRRPEAFVDLPLFNGDQLEEARSGGDLSVQACADDPQVAFHAVRQLARLADGVATLRWLQSGYTANFGADDTPRNLMGFKDGTQNPIAVHPREKVNGVVRQPLSPDEVVWVGAEGPEWMRGGSYVVMRRIRMALEHWDATDIEFQEQTIGRHKVSGAPLGGTDEFEALDLDATDKDGMPLIADNAHVRMAAAAGNDGAQILRRGYSYNDGVNVTAERWPPWRSGLEYDVGLLFVCYQRDPRTGFIRLFEPMAKLDALNQYTTHTGGGMFACPGGVAPGGSIGDKLFAA